jgi:branched-subunit amino acid transport protein AzlD
MKEVILVAVMAIVTILLRFLPFLVIRKETPPYISYLGRVLPPAIIGMLVIYCLKDVNPAPAPHGIPELISVLCVVLLQVWRRNSLVSILGGTLIYMVLVQQVF